MKCKLGAYRDLWDVGFRVMLLVGPQQELKISGLVKASCLIFVQQYFLFPVASIHKRTSGAEKGRPLRVKTVLHRVPKPCSARRYL